MRLEDQSPVEVVDCKFRTGGKESTITHPAFAQIGASRVSGNATLYGSEFKHQHYMTITIRRSELHRSLSRDWAFGREELIEVALSEAQWATFVSTTNHDTGVQCTLSHIQGNGVPGIKPAKSSHERFASEMHETVKEIQQALKSMAEGMDGAMSKTKVSELRKSLDMWATRLTSSTGFVADQFDEHMEQTVEKAKIEVNAYVTGVVQRAGLEAIAGGNQIVALIGQDKDEK